MIDRSIEAITANKRDRYLIRSWFKLKVLLGTGWGRRHSYKKYQIKIKLHHVGWVPGFTLLYYTSLCIVSGHFLWGAAQFYLVLQRLDGTEHSRLSTYLFHPLSIWLFQTFLHGPKGWCFSCIFGLECLRKLPVKFDDLAACQRSQV